MKLLIYLTVALWRYDSTLSCSDAAESVCLFVGLSSSVCRLRFGTTVCPIGQTKLVLAVFFRRVITAARRFIDPCGPKMT